ncbi:MAG: sugar ABC transporter permease, partial [Chloroflexota bacterium]|nr:sugar ABC transporter permease [Chloroflexota bacterium]
FIAPYLIIAGVFTVGLLVYAFYISFTDLESTLQREVGFVGLDNYIQAFRDREFRTALLNVLWYFLIVTTFQTIFAILLATLLNGRIKGLRIFRTLFYAPSVTSSVVISMIFLWLYLPSGFINYALGLVGLPAGTAWMANPRGVIQNIASLFGTDITNSFLRGPSVTWTAIMAMNIFTTAPTLMLMFLAALQDIPEQVYEAAAIDGATGVRQFFSITLPLLRPTIVLVVVLGTIGTFQVFDQVALMTRGGPLNTTLTPTYLIYTKTLGSGTSANAALAAAMAFILAFIIFVITYLQRRYIESGTERY